MNVHASPAAQTLSHEERLDRLAQVAVRVGLGLQAGQEVVMTAPLEAVDLARRITEHAYKAGASLVTTLFADEEATLMRFRYGADAGFDKATGWLFEGMAAAYAIYWSNRAFYPISVIFFFLTRLASLSRHQPFFARRPWA